MGNNYYLEFVYWKKYITIYVYYKIKIMIVKKKKIEMKEPINMESNIDFTRSKRRSTKFGLNLIELF